MGNDRQVGCSWHGRLRYTGKCCPSEHPGAVFRPLRSKEWSSVDLWTETSTRNPAATHLLAIAKEVFTKSTAKSGDK